MSTKTTPATSTSVLTATSPVSSGTITADAASLGADSLPSAEALQTRSTRTRKRGEMQGRESRGLRRADALAAAGQVDKALAQLRKLVHDMPESTRSYLRMATLLKEVQRPGEALVVLRSAIEHAPRVPAPREALAEMCLEMGRWEEAIQQSRALLSLSPRSLVARDVLSAAYFQSGQLDQALRITNEMIALDPTDTANHFKRGVLLQQKGCIAGALEAFSRVISMAPDSEAAEESRAAVEMLDNYQMRQIISRAMEDVPFRVALLQNPAEAIETRGYALSDRGLAAVARVPLADLPTAPPGWRQYLQQ